MGELEISDVPLVYVHGLEKTPAAIREHLDPERRAQFEAEYRAALAEASESFDLAPLLRLVEQKWWVRAVICKNPEMMDGVAEDIRRVVAEDPTVFAPEDQETD